MTPLTPVQETILDLLGMSATVYTDLVTGPSGGRHVRYLNPEPKSADTRPSITKVRYLAEAWLRTYTSILRSAFALRRCTA